MTRYLLPLAFLLAACTASDNQETSPDQQSRVAATAEDAANPDEVLTYNDPDIRGMGIVPADETDPLPPLPDAVDGKVGITVDRLVSEDQACLMMMTVMNGTDETVSAGLFAFDVTGNDNRYGANMFPQTAAPGERATGQIVLMGADCEDAQVIEGGQLSCTYPGMDGSCTDDLVLIDDEVAFEVE